MRAVESSLKKLDTNYIDIMLVHQPFGDYYGSWRAMEELYDQNVLRGLGLSNFYEDRLIDLLYHCNVKPVVNQIECHPFNQRQSLLQLMRKHQVVGMAWSPFTRDRQPIFDHPIIKSLAEKYGVTKHQIILRWHIQRGHHSIAKGKYRKAIWKLTLMYSTSNLLTSTWTLWNY